MSDVKRMIALDLDRLTPFQADQIYFDADIVSRDAENGRQQVAVGVLRRDAAAEILSDVLRPGPDACGAGREAARRRVDAEIRFPRRDARGRRRGPAQRRSSIGGVGVAALLILNFVILTWRDSSSLDQLRQAVESQAARWRSRCARATASTMRPARRAQLLDAKEKLSPLPVLDAVTAVMPQDAWVRRFEWNGRSVHIIGARKTSQDILQGWKPRRCCAMPVRCRPTAMWTPPAISRSRCRRSASSSRSGRGGDDDDKDKTKTKTKTKTATKPSAAQRPAAASDDSDDDDDSSADDGKPNPAARPHGPPRGFLLPGAPSAAWPGPSIREGRNRETARAARKKDRRLGILVAVLVVIWFGLIDPLIVGFIGRAEDRSDLLATYQKNERILSSISTWRDQADQQSATQTQYGIVAPTSGSRRRA